MNFDARPFAKTKFPKREGRRVAVPDSRAGKMPALPKVGFAPIAQEIDNVFKRLGWL